MPRAKSPIKDTQNGDARTNGPANISNKRASALQTSSAPESNASRANVPLPSRTTDTSVHPSVSEEQVRRRAYELYRQRGGTDGRHTDDWFRAEAELRGHR
jgi:DUF2934 family protein